MLRSQFAKLDKEKFHNKRILKSDGSSFDKMRIHYDFVNLDDEIYNEITTNREKYFIFSVVRNPWDRLVSFYKHATRDVISFTNYFYQDSYNSFEELKKESLKYLFEKVKNFSLKEFLQYYENYYSHDSREYLKISEKTQISWIKRKDCEKTICDKIYKFENLQELKEDMKNMFDIDIDVDEKINDSVHNHCSEYYDEELKDLISNRFKEDTEYFGYKFEYKSTT